MTLTDDQLEALARGITAGPWGRGADLETVMTDYRNEFGNMTHKNWIPGGHPKIIAKTNKRGWMDWDEQSSNTKAIALVPQLLAEVIALRGELRRIAEQDDIEMVLDPTWAKRIAKGALS